MKYLRILAGLLFISVNVVWAHTITSLPIDLGDSIEKVQSALETDIAPESFKSAVEREARVLRLKSQGVWVFFDANGIAYNIRLDAPFSGNIRGIGIGSSHARVIENLGQPAKILKDYPSGLAPYIYYVDETTAVRIDFGISGLVDHFFVLKPVPIDPFKRQHVSITPIFGQIVAFTQPAGFKVVFENTSASSYIREATPEGQTLENWTQMITITGAKGLASKPDLSPKKFAEAIAGGFQKSCPSSYRTETILDGTLPEGQPVFTAVIGCGKTPTKSGAIAETTLVTVIGGQSDYYTIQWAERSTPVEGPIALDIGLWTKRLKTLSPLKVCNRQPGEPAPYPSCISAAAVPAGETQSNKSSVIDERLRNASVTEERLNNGAIIRNIKFAGSLQSNVDLGCVSIDEVSSAFNPPALIFAAKKCIQEGKYQSAWELVTTGNGFAYYDLKRLADRSTQGALSVLSMNAFNDLTSGQRTELSKTFKEIQMDSAKVNAYCTQLKKIGPPNYVPKWAILHGIGAYQEPRNGDYLTNVDAAALWDEVLKTRCAVKAS